MCILDQRLGDLKLQKQPIFNLYVRFRECKHSVSVLEVLPTDPCCLAECESASFNALFSVQKA